VLTNSVVYAATLQAGKRCKYALWIEVN